MPDESALRGCKVWPDNWRNAAPPFVDLSNNPKDRIGRTKAPMHCVPPSALLWLGHVMRGGADKYGPFNWVRAKIAWSVYFDAAMRHLFAMQSGEDIDPESGAPHAAHVMACMAIMLDAMEGDNMLDDRAVPLPSTARAAAKIAAKMETTK